jgi:hypothetical protein
MAVDENRKTVELTRQEHAQYMSCAIKKFKALQPALERDHRGEYVAISAKYGRYVTAPSEKDVTRLAKSFGKDDFVWITRIGSS